MKSRADKARAVARLQEDVDAGAARPNFSRAASELGIHAETLRRWWGEAQQRAKLGGELVVLPPPDEPRVSASGFDPLTASDLDYWVFRWGQTQQEIPNAGSDAGRVSLLRMQDEVWTSLRAALERARDERGLTPDEIREQLVTAAEALPARLAADVVEVLRRRGLVA
jgi:hypothetical protein